jgi:hypothetical protein
MSSVGYRICGVGVVAAAAADVAVDEHLDEEDHV